MLDYKRHRDSLKLELTPLLDIIFILLIFFAVSTSLVTHHQGLKLDLPQAKSATIYESSFVISVNAKKEIVVNKKRVLLSLLSREIKEILSLKPDIKIMLNADRQLPYAFVIDVLDAIRLGGGSDIVLQAEKVVIPE